MSKSPVNSITSFSGKFPGSDEIIIPTDELNFDLDEGVWEMKISSLCAVLHEQVDDIIGIETNFLKTYEKKQGRRVVSRVQIYTFVLKAQKTDSPIQLIKDSDCPFVTFFDPPSVLKLYFVDPTTKMKFDRTVDFFGTICFRRIE